MLSTALTILALGGSTAQRLPDQLDVLRGADRTPQVRLLIDLSGSMLNGHQAQADPCSYYIANRGGLLQNPVNGDLSRIDQLIAVLTGCRSANDGILDTWASRMVFGVDSFEGNNLTVGVPLNLRQWIAFPTGGRPAYSTNLTSLESAVLSLQVPGFGAATPLIPGYHQSALRFLDFNNSNTEQCRQNAIVIMTDGVGNSGEARTFSQVAGTVADVTARDERGCYEPSILPAGGLPTGTCAPEFAPPHGDVAARYLHGETGPTGLRHDALPNVDGVQPIRTYTIGFNVPSTPALRLLEDMAAVGGGEYLEAENYQELYDSFDRIMTTIRANAETSFRGITVQGDGLFSGNYIYQNSFQGVEDGHWFGNVKKFCILPATRSGTDCLLEWSAAANGYVVNDDPRDIWTGRPGVDTQVGGGGARIWNQMNPGMTSFDTPVPTSGAYSGREIITWDESTSSYVDVSPLNGTFGPDDSFTLDLCAHYALLNKLYGYTYDTAGCTLSTVAPVAFDLWPLADTVNGGQVILRYGDTCEGTSANCYLVTVSNAGMLHIFATGTGNETQAVIPPQFFTPNQAAHNTLAQVMRQPTLDTTRRYYFDGGVSVYHDDVDGNGYINGGEPAYLVAGFGRGGSAYIKWDVSRLDGGRMSQSNNPPHPLFIDQSTGLQHLRDTWAAPWLGNYQLQDGRIRPVAIFPTGHQPELDDPSAAFAALTNAPPPPSGDTETSPFTASCTDLGIPAEVCSTPSMRTVCLELAGVPAGLCGSTDTCSACNLADPVACGAAGFNAPYCYNWPGLAGFDPAPLARFGITGLNPLRISAGPFGYTNTVTTGGCGPTTVQGEAYRIHFSRLDLQPGDSLIIYDGNGIEVQRFTGSYPGGAVSEWIRAPQFRFRVVTDGVNDTVADGYTISSIDVIRDVAPASTCINTRPGIYVMDLEEWNGQPSGFAEIPGPGVDRQAAGVLARFTSDCTDSSSGPDEICIDQNTSAETRDLRFMVCPISAEPSVLTEGGLAQSIYFGDECGQVWALKRNPAGTSWTARRLLSTNRTTGGFVVAGESRHYRKIFAQLDLVSSTCTGRRAVGVYFGTGNLQRPAAIPSVPALITDPPRNLENTSITRFAGMANSFESDVMGVVWDTPDVPPGGYVLSDLANVTTVEDIDPTSAGANQSGFFQELNQDEKILRGPLVFDGVAFFQSYQPVRAANECDDAVGVGRTYAFDNCTAAPVRANVGAGTRPDRQIASNPNSFIGQGISVIIPTPESGEGPIVLGGDSRAGDVADLQAARDDEPQNGVRLLMWRINVD